MAKKKLRRFAENKTFEHVFEPNFHEITSQEFTLKNKWAQFFKNSHPITLELGCGKGEYTVALAQKSAERNYIGVDIKGARIWRGAKTVAEKQLKHVAFLRTRIDQIEYAFGPEDQVDEIWITFPDPQPQESREKKRLTSPRFLNRYRSFLKPGGTINLKTDSKLLYTYTKEVIQQQQLPLFVDSANIYTDFPDDPILSIRTFYEQKWLQQGLKIHYLRFGF